MTSPVNTKIHDFKELLDAINTPGGHILIATGIGTIGVIVAALGILYVWPDEKLAIMLVGLTAGMTSFLSIAAYAMQGRDKANGKSTSTTTTKTVETTPSTAVVAPIVVTDLPVDPSNEE